MKKSLSTLLALAMLLSLCMPALAAENTAEGIDTTQAVTTAQDPGEAAADVLHELGLFNGVGVNAEGKPIYDLDRAPTRLEALIMLVRLLGKEQEALAGTWEHPFTDVPDWGNAIVGYAYEHKLTGGVAATLYGSEEPATVSMYLTFVLRAMGYQDPDEFQWDSAWTLTDKLGITDGTAQEGTFLRGDVAAISLKALPALQKDGTTLASRLIESGVFTEEQAVKAGVMEQSEDPLAVVNQSSNTSYDIHHPNGDIPAISMKEAGALISREREPSFSPSDKGLTPSGYTRQDENGYSAIEWSKYVQVTDDVVGILTSECHFVTSACSFVRSVNLNIELYAGETVQFNGTDLGLDAPTIQGDNYTDVYWCENNRNIAASATVKNNLVTITTKVNTASNYGGEPLMGTLFGTADFQERNKFTYEATWNGQPITYEGDERLYFYANVAVYHKAPKTLEPSFTLRPQYSQNHYVELGTGDTFGSCRIWDVENGLEFDQSKPSRTARNNESDWLYVYPAENSGIPSHVLSDEGYILPEYLEEYYRVDIVKGSGYYVKNGDDGRIMIYDRATLDNSECMTVRVTSRYDGTCADIDFVYHFLNEPTAQ